MYQKTHGGLKSRWTVPDSRGIRNKIVFLKVLMSVILVSVYVFGLFISFCMEYLIICLRLCCRLVVWSWTFVIWIEPSRSVGGWGTRWRRRNGPGWRTPWMSQKWYIVKLFLRIIFLNKHVTWIKPFRLNYLGCNLYQMLLWQNQMSDTFTPNKNTMRICLNEM